jgi:hypothetical protein
LRAATTALLLLMDRLTILNLTIAAALILYSVFWPPILLSKTDTSKPQVIDLVHRPAEQAAARQPLRFRF